jgi:DNA-binding NarL/FixJ family response regulator
MEQTTVLIIEDHRLLRETWREILNGDPSLLVTGVAGTAEEGIRLASVTRPVLVLMDINLPGMNGIEATRQIKRRIPSTLILAVSMHTDIATVKRVMRSGASGYLTKCAGKKELFTAIRQVLKGSTYLCDHIKDIMSRELLDKDEKKTIYSLSERERSIAMMVRQGYSSREIAEKYCISAKTVEVHRYNILQKLELRNSSALVDFLNHYGY